ncbi:DUF998 domain-containing protein [Streptomyces sp. NPDC050856]|uniref:DUF998 domain-containing protein n=1 Tax=Streptomyces sp. NPDC050856 TaxID=3154939 RepID=UPI0033CBFEF0
MLYNCWLLELVLPTGLDPRHSYVSELYAADQPYRAVFGGTEAACALLLGTVALLVRGRATGAVARAGWWALAGFAGASLGDVLLPMRCAPSVEPACEAVHVSHTVTSALVHFFLFSAMVLLVRAPGAGRWGPVVLGCALVSSVSTVGPLIGHPGWHGVPQRAHLLVVGVWLVLLARSVLVPPARERRPGPAPEEVGAWRP